MYVNIFTKTSRDRITGMLVGMAAMALFLWMGLAVYRDIDLSLYYESLPPAVLEMMGIPPGADAAGLAYGAMYSFMGALTIAGLAISMGTASIAGEESSGTLGLLLANPRSRTSVLLSKAASMLAIVLVGGVILWLAGLTVPALLGVDMAGYDVVALVVHLVVNAVFYGTLAMAVGAWTGKAKAASGVAIALMVISYLAYGILPLIEGTETLQKLFPWYYFANGAPVLNGTDWGDLGILAGLSILFVALAVVGVNRRDLRSRGVSTSLLDRLREQRVTKRVVERIAGQARVSGVAAKTASEHQGLLIVCSIIMFYIALMMGPIYSVMDDAVLDLADQFPDVLVAMIGGANMATFEGFLVAEIFAITGPITFGVLVVLIGARAIAGEEEKNTMDLLLASPVSRSSVIVQKALALVGYTLALGVVTFLGTWATVALSTETLEVGNIAATSALLTLLGLVFGGFTLFLGSATGKSRIASYGGAGFILVSYFLFSFLPLSDTYGGWVKISPYWYFLGSDPLVNGMHWGHAAILAGVFTVLVALSMPALERRDLR